MRLSEGRPAVARIPGWAARVCWQSPGGGALTPAAPEEPQAARALHREGCDVTASVANLRARRAGAAKG